MTASMNDLPVEPRRIPSVVRHAGVILPVLIKSAQHPSAVMSAYLQKKHRLPSEEKRAVSALAFHALRLLPAAVYTASQAAREIHWDIGLAVPPKHGWFYVKFLSEEAGIAVAASAVLLGAHTFPESLSPEDISESPAEAVRTALKEHTACPNPDKWCAAVMENWRSLNDNAQQAVQQPGPDEAAQELLAVRACVQPWILESWATAHPDGFAYALRLADSLMAPSPVGIRVAGDGGMRESLRDTLKKLDIHARFGNLSPAALILEERARVTSLDAYRDGVFEIQDEGSQLIGYAAAPVPGEMVLDACAGAGGKTLHLASLMNNAGRILAADTEFMRLKQVLPRAARAGIDCIEILPTRRLEQALDSHREQFATVLIDAPCTSLGTARRYPIPKWRLEQKSVNKIVETQKQILDRYASTVRPGGVLVYATCSLLPQENAGVVEAFLDDHPEFTPDPLSSVFESHGVAISGLSDSAALLQLTPLEHGTDGFFMTRFIRT